jgi:hypothetical protein
LWRQKRRGVPVHARAGSQTSVSIEAKNAPLLARGGNTTQLDKTPARICAGTDTNAYGPRAASCCWLVWCQGKKNRRPRAPRPRGHGHTKINWAKKVGGSEVWLSPRKVFPHGTPNHVAWVRCVCCVCVCVCVYVCWFILCVGFVPLSLMTTGCRQRVFSLLGLAWLGLPACETGRNLGR